MIKVIVFDLGNVIITDDFASGNKKIMKAFSKEFNISISKMELVWTTYHKKFYTGKETENKFWKRYLKKCGANEIDVNTAKKLLRKNQEEIENMIYLLKKLKKKKYRLASITSITKEWLKFKIKKYHLDRYFEKIISTAETGLVKYKREIYKLAAKRLKVKPNEVLFIDNSWYKILPAKAVGFNTILFRGQKKLEKRLSKMGIL